MGARPFGQRAATRSVADYAKDQIKQEGRWSDTELPRGPRSLNGASRTCSGIGPVGTKRQSEPSLPGGRATSQPALNTATSDVLAIVPGDHAHCARKHHISVDGDDISA
jgi:hypothetical protein